MPDSQPTKERLTIFLPPQIKAAIIREAEVAGQNLSVWVERTIAKHLNATGTQA